MFFSEDQNSSFVSLEEDWPDCEDNLQNYPCLNDQFYSQACFQIRLSQNATVNILEV